MAATATVRSEPRKADVSVSLCPPRPIGRQRHPRGDISAGPWIVGRRGHHVTASGGIAGRPGDLQPCSRCPWMPPRSRTGPTACVRGQPGTARPASRTPTELPVTDRAGQHARRWQSTVGQQLARRLDWGFVDSTASSKERIGESIRAYFERQGEEAFRDISEERVIDELTRRSAGRSRHRRRRLLATRTAASCTKRCTVVTCVRRRRLFRRAAIHTQRPLLQVADPWASCANCSLSAIPSTGMQPLRHRDRAPAVPMLVNMIPMQLELWALCRRHLAQFSPVEPPAG